METSTQTKYWCILLFLFRKFLPVSGNTAKRGATTQICKYLPSVIVNLHPSAFSGGDKKQILKSDKLFKLLNAIKSRN